MKGIPQTSSYRYIHQSPAEELLKANARTLSGREFWHALRNAASHPDFDRGERAIALHDAGEMADRLDLQAFPTNTLHMVEIAARLPSEFGSTQIAEVARAIMARLLPLRSEMSVADGLVDALRHVLGYDHLVLWRIEPMGTARAIAESKRRTLPSKLGAECSGATLWPAPAPFADVIADVAAAMPPLLSIGYAPVPDLTSAQCRAPDLDHVEALNLAGLCASLRLRLRCNDAPWGILEAQSTLPRRPSGAVLLLMEVLQFFVDAKLRAISKD